jgi:hypothetical protein
MSVVYVLMPRVLERRTARLATGDSGHFSGTVFRDAVPTRPTNSPVALSAKATKTVACGAVYSEQRGRLYFAALCALLFSRDVICPGSLPLLLAVGVIAKIRAFPAPRIRPSAGVYVEVIKRLRFATINARRIRHRHLL